jgi:hypothetical protein
MFDLLLRPLQRGRRGVCLMHAKGTARHPTDGQPQCIDNLQGSTGPNSSFVSIVEISAGLPRDELQWQV